MSELQKKTLGLYVHIPFCSFMCHYCDFAKTAHWSEGLIREYMQILSRHLRVWLGEFVQRRGYEVDTLFLGGGTPGLLGSELEELFRVFSEFNISFREASLEINPENASEERLKLWKSFGFNRVSMGVQSFQDKGLRSLTRQHDSQHVRHALENVLKNFENVNCDLIYAWKGQTFEDWKQDLEIVQTYPISHLSLYCLTLEERTPLGRAFQRGKFIPETDLFQEQCYDYAREVLSNTFEHYECSNWSKPGKHCVHNAKYWQDEYFIGVGAGACGYVPDGDFGLRYAYTRKERVFTKSPLVSSEFLQLPECEFESRSAEQWLTEYVGCGLRFKEGVDLQKIYAKTGLTWTPKGWCEQGLHEGVLRIADNRLFLDTKEWFRETSWCVEVLKHFTAE